jgi:hypothetical protein
MIDIDIAHIKAKVLTTTLQLVNDPRIMKVLSYPSIMNAVSKGLKFKEKFDATLRIWREE